MTQWLGHDTSGEAAAAVKGKVLFVDDEKRVLNSMRGMFRRDYELFLTTDGSEAVSAASAHDVDVIVADQRMPGMSGVEVLEQIRQVSPRTVRILLTGYADPEAIQGSINVGEVFRFLSKPCPPALLRETLQLAVAASRVRAGQAIGSPEDRSAPTPSAPEQHDVETKVAAAPATTAERQAPVLVDAVSADPPVETRADTVPAGIVPDVEPRIPDPAPVVDAAAAADVAVSTPDEQDGMRGPAAAPSAGSSERVTESRRIRLNASSVGVVAFSSSRLFVSSVRSAVAQERTLIVASTLREVATALSEHRAGVFVTDASADINLLQRVIGALKQYLPELVTIVVSDSRDANDMINLINYGQVYRYNVKPIDPLTLRTDINAAVLKHLQLLNHPELIQRHQVIELQQSDEGSTSPTLNRFLGTVTRLRGLWSGIGQKSH